MSNKNKLSIYLLKPNIEKVEDIFDNTDDIKVFKKFDADSIAYFIPSDVHTPSWVKSFFHQDKTQNLLQANSRVVLIKRMEIGKETRYFALTFGYARFLFKDGVLEEQFGLKIILNTIKQNQIRRIAKSSVGSNQKQSDEQLPKSSDISEFGFDINRDLMKSVSGKSDDEMFEKSMLTGGDIFSLTVERDINNIDDFLIYCYEKYKEDTYKEKFAWIDNIKYVKDKGAILALNNRLLEEINAQNYDRVWMSVPEVISWENVKDFKISNVESTFEDIYIENVVNSFNEKITDVKQLQNKRISARSSTDDSKNAYEWSAYKCIIAEIKYNDQQYCLNNGRWYRIDNSFVSEIEKKYASIALCDFDFIDYIKDKSSEKFSSDKYNEDEYNDDLHNSLTDSYLLHKYKISIGGGQGNNIEPCDLLWTNKLIHVKKNGGSSVLSHLFNQALVAGQAWLDDDFRNKLRAKMLENGEDVSFLDNFKSNDYEIIIAIINKFSEDRPKIPFFSKVAICFTYTNITNLGYGMKLKNIQMK